MKMKLSAIAIAIALSPSANAAFITENFTSTVIGGPFDASVATGSFEYDDTLITGSGAEVITVLEGLIVDLTVFGQLFTEIDDINISNGFPSLEFVNGTPTLLDFYVSEQAMFGGVDITAINLAGVDDFGLFSLTPDGGGDYVGNFAVNAVPVPAAVWLFGSGLLGLIGIARRKKA